MKTALRFILITAISAFYFINLNAQADKNAVLFTIAGEPVTVGEFEYVYTKNNINNQADYSEKSLTEYLELYKNFRLKVKEAEVLRYDTITSLINELEGYRKQLAKTYLTDKEISEKLLQEAYDRYQRDVNASHILIRCDENAAPPDTLAAYKKALNIRQRILKGEDFGKLARELSEDPSAKDNSGNLGWFSVFQMIYPFESAAYSLKPGEVSMPVRTQFGYHIIRLNQTRPAQGEIRVAHLLLKFPEGATEEQKKNIGLRIDSIYNAIISGSASFEDAVAKFSEDRTTRNRKGELPWFGTGRMVPEFEEAAFALPEDNAISKPVKTAYGWHIIKRLEKRPLPPFNDVKAELKRKVERDSRSALAKTILIERLKKDYNYKEFNNEKKEIFALIDTNVTKGNWTAGDLATRSKPLITFADKKFTQGDFASYVEKIAKRRGDKNKDQLLEEYFANFVGQALLDYEESILEKKKPEFKALMKEYRDGILLFELTDRTVWSKAAKDTIGLQSFYEKNKNKYMWGERIHVVIFNTSDKKLADKAYKLALKNKDPEYIKLKLNKQDAKAKISTIEGKYEKGQYNVVDEIEWKKGVTPVKMLDDSSYRFIWVKGIVPPEPKSLKEAKGYVVSDYQEYLEKTWLDELRKKYPIVVDEKVFRSLIRKI
ncbi:MAG: peptidylprolyl isomerase [Chitinophagales bacterium]|nr:peptidylprolyl isomerase [Chitinophagales bacterium]MDW8274565.1 peptidylprolyl isomerase [Chitinophagales bacterium]